MKNKFLITGGSGFLGQWLVRKLLEFYPASSIISISRNPSSQQFVNDPRVDWRYCRDIRDSSISKDFLGVDVVIHSAAYCSLFRKDQNELIDINRDGTKNILNICKKQDIKRVIYIGSTAMIGGSKDGTLRDEFFVDRKNNLKKPYSYSKQLAQEVVDEFSGIIPIISVLPGMILGSWDFGNTSKLVNTVKNFSMICPPGGTSVIDIRDVVDAIVYLFEKGACGEKYIVSNQNLSYFEITSVIAKRLDKNPPKWIVPSVFEHLPMRLIEFCLGKLSPISYEQFLNAFLYRYFSNDKIKKLGWSAKYDLDDSLDLFFDWKKESAEDC